MRGAGPGFGLASFCATTGAAITQASIPTRRSVVRGAVSCIEIPPWSRKLARVWPFLRPEQSKLGAVGHDELAQHSHVLRRISRLKSRDRDFFALLDHARLVAVADHAARCPRFERPTLRLAGLILDVEVEPRMRVCEAHFDDRALDCDRLLHVVHGSERMMPGRDRRGERQRSACEYYPNSVFHRWVSTSRRSARIRDAVDDVAVVVAEQQCAVVHRRYI